MSTAGPKIAGTGADGGGANAWSNPSNITANDAVFSSVVLGIGSVTNELLATNFNFAVPNGAAIVSVQVDVFRAKT